MPAVRSVSMPPLLLPAVLGLLLLGALASAPLVVRSASAETGAIEPHAHHDPQTDCTRDEQPGVEAVRDLVLAAYPGTRDGGIVRACDRGGPSEHKEGRAWDWMVDAHDPEEAAQAGQLLSWLLATDEDGNEQAMARRLGVMYVIWDGRIWSQERADEGWRDYGGASPHTDHVHLSFTRRGAAMETTYWDAPDAHPAPGELP